MSARNSSPARRGAVALAPVLCLTASSLLLAVTQNWYVDVNAPGCPTGTGTQADPFCNIMDAVAVAADGDTILVAPGTYIENVVIDRDLDLIGTGGQEVTILDGAAGGSVVRVLDSAVTLTGLTLNNGTGTLDSYSISRLGGGLMSEGSRVRLTSCTVSGNSADYGGGLACSDGELELIDSLVAGNAAGDGGGIFADYSGGLGPGSCEWVFSHLLLTNSTVSANTALWSGGGICAGYVTATGSSISGNRAGAGGEGGVGAGIFAPNVHLIDSIVEKNVFLGDYGGGGGIAATAGVSSGCAPPSSLSLTNVRVTNNQALYLAGVFASARDQVTITNTTVSNNVNASGVGVAGLSLSKLLYGGGLVSNSIVAHNTPSALYIGDSVTVQHSLLEGGWPGTGNLDADPRFVDPASGDYRLLHGSPCIDAGDNAAVPAGSTTDLRGFPRFLDDRLTPDRGVGVAPIVDMGACEGAVPVTPRVQRR